MEHFLEGIALVKRHWYVNSNEKSNKYKSFLLSYLTYQSLYGALPSRKCPEKWIGDHFPIRS